MARQPDKQTQFEILAEAVRSEVRTMAEGHHLLDQKIDRTREALEQRIGFLETAVLDGFRDVRQGFQRLEQRMAGLEQWMDGMEHRLDGIESWMGQHDQVHRS